MLQDRTAINKLLMSHGLGTLEEGPALVSQLAFLVRDHAHLGQLLMRCGPRDRPAMYDSMKPYLRFAAKPLDHYLIEAQREAEVRQLPVLDPETGFLREYRVPEIESAVRAGVDEALATGHIEVTCKTCTRVAVFPGRNKADAVQKAREAGWTYRLNAENQGREICPECP